jgi:branched-chain amino acid transport system ATP-binding protein
VPEGRRIFGRLTVEENLRAGGMGNRDRAAKAAAHARVHDLFPVLAERSGQRAGLLSGGEQQMLAIGRALMASPKLLLLDEPSLGLAPRVIGQIGEVVAEINRQGTSVLLVEQNATMALGVADLAYVLDVGKVSLSGPAAELARTDEVQRLYLGTATRPPPIRPPAAPAARSPGGPRDRGRRADPARRPAGRGRARQRPLRRHQGAVRRLVHRAPGAIHAVIGPNGAGKSTMFNVLSGVYKAAEGEVRFGDARLDRMRPFQIAGVGVARAFQNIALSGAQSVAENLMLGRHHLTKAGFLSSGLRLPRATREGRRHGERIREIAEFLDLGDKLHTPVGVLSYGDQKRVEVARALCTEPRLLLLDEPVAGMNAEETSRMAEAIRRSAPRSASRSSWSSTTWGWSCPWPTGSPSWTSDVGSPTAPRRGAGRPRGHPRLPGLGRRRDPRRGRGTPHHRHARDDLVTQFLSLLLNGLSLGAIYALIALGFVIIFKASEVVSFTHGSLLLLGAYSIARLSGPLGFLGAVLVGLVITALAALLVERFIINRLRGAPVISLAIVTIGVDIILLTELIRRIGPDILNVPHPWGGESVRIGGIGISQNRLIAMVVAGLLIARSSPPSSTRAGAWPCARRRRTARPRR